jgi:hypothetical protein
MRAINLLQLMALFKLSHFKFRHRPVRHQSAPVAPATGQTIEPSSASLQPKSVTELEQQMAAEQRLRAQPVAPIKHVVRRSLRVTRKGSPLRLIIVALLIGIPTGVIWLVNLPYAAIRRPVAEKMPILLLPSYLSLDQNYRLAITTFEQAQQLIDNATTPIDLELGEQKLVQAQTSLDALPIDWINDRSYAAYGGYNWQFSRSHFNHTRAEVGRLKAKVFQEKNAQDLLFKAEQSLTTAKQNYPQAKTNLDRQTTITQWKTALDQLQQIPGETLAGKSAQQNLSAYQRDFQEMVGLAAGNQRTLVLLNAAREYSQRAAQQGQNPPHAAEQWRQIIQLWEGAIEQVELIPSTDVMGYAEAQQMRAEYQQNLGQIRIRLQAEESSVRAFEQAQQQATFLLKTATGANQNYTKGELQNIIDQFNQVKSGTTVYLEAQRYLVSAQNKLDQFKP